MLDKFDRAILNLLLQNSRTSYNKIAERINLSASACQRRIKVLEEINIIERFTLALNNRALGQEIQAFVMIKVNRHQVALVQQFLDIVTAYPEVTACHQLTGENDFLLEVYSRDLDSYANFINDRILAVPAVRDACSSIVLKQIKSYRSWIQD